MRPAAATRNVDVIPLRLPGSDRVDEGRRLGRGPAARSDNGGAVLRGKLRGVSPGVLGDIGKKAREGGRERVDDPALGGRDLFGAENLVIESARERRDAILKE